jgi:flagellar hook-length control protein FliK
MNQTMQVARAGPIRPAGQPVKPVGRFDPSSGASFEEALTKEIQKERAPSAEADEPAPAERDADRKPEEKTPTADAAAAPVAAVLTPPAKPVEPPPGEAKVALSTTGTSETGAVSAVGMGTGVVAAGGMGQPVMEGGTAQIVAGTLTAVPAGDVLPQASETAPQVQKTAPKTDAFQAALDTSQDASPAIPAALQYQQTAQAHRPSLNDLQVPAPAQQAQHQTFAREVQTAAQDPAPEVTIEPPPTAEPAAQAPAATVDPTSARAAQPVVEGAHLTTAASQTFEPARLAEAQNKEMVWQISQNVESMLKSRQTTLRLQLYPEELGRIDLRLTTGSAGMGVSLIAQQASTGQLLESQVATLRQALDQAGIHLAHLSVGQQQSQASSGGSNRQGRGQTGQRELNSVIQTTLDERRVTYSLNPSEGLDYRV